MESTLIRLTRVDDAEDGTRFVVVSTISDYIGIETRVFNLYGATIESHEYDDMESATAGHNRIVNSYRQIFNDAVITEITDGNFLGQFK